MTNRSVFVSQAAYERHGHEWIVDWLNTYYGFSDYMIIWDTRKNNKPPRSRLRFTQSQKPTRYYKASDGERIYFRATKTTYTALKPDRRNHRVWTRGKGPWPAVEITEAEYDQLGAAKLARLDGGYAYPQDFWIYC